MKSFYNLASLALLSTIFATAVCATTPTTPREKLSYALGVNIGNLLKKEGFADLDFRFFMQALQDIYENRNPQVTMEESKQLIVAHRQKTQNAHAEKARAKGDSYRIGQRAKAGTSELPQGILYEILKKGSGAKPAVTDTVTVHYHGTLISGQVFDSSISRGQPITLPLQNVIKGWQIVLPLMPVGSKWRVIIPPEFAYGSHGAGGVIGPHETLIFEIELIEIKRP